MEGSLEEGAVEVGKVSRPAGGQGETWIGIILCLHGNGCEGCGERGRKEHLSQTMLRTG